VAAGFDAWLTKLVSPDKLERLLAGVNGVKARCVSFGSVGQAVGEAK
jgi:hypothetical protein